MSDHAHDSHTGPIKTPAQLLWTSFFSFVVPVFVIIGLVYYVTSGNKPAAGSGDPELATAQRIQRIGSVELRDANRPLASGEEVFKAQCSACHATGAAGSPKFGDAAAWGPRIGAGYEALLNSALKGKNAMGAQGGGAYSDTEIGRAVVYMANAGGAKFAEPKAPAAAGAAAPAAEAAPAAAPAAAAPAAPAAAAPAAAATPVANAGEALYKQTCATCHGAGVAGAPKFGDKAAWAPRVGLGLDGLTASAIKGKNAMPPKGGSTASDADIKAAISYMLAAVK
ncbi:c-type cytochrome [Hydrogenophaga sp. RWCD_12]|uniref:c-type cytochrome n=1 Tax=Hydrogenophaga sp. RWCD_12 TaxID=3391190 RepID=UPI0039851856